MRSHLLPALLLTASICAAQDKSVSLDARVRARIRIFHGAVSLYAKNLKTGQAYGLRENDPVRTASTIKLAIMIECFFEASEGKLDWKEPITLPETEKVSGSGVIQDFSAGDSFPIRDLMNMMIVVSDNTATNLILNRISGQAVNERLEGLGLTETRVMRKILGDRSDLKPNVSGVTSEGAKPENAKWGIGRSSPKEMVGLLEKIYRGELVNRAASDEMLAVLKHQRDHNAIGRYRKDTVIANKSGALDHLRSDVGIVYTKNGPVAIAVTVENIPEITWTPDNPGELLIASLSEILIDGLKGN
jgi:beta-lactamase class A